MDQNSKRLEEMLASLEELAERYDEYGIEGYDEIMDTLNDIEGESSILLEICGPINAYGLLLHQVQCKINRLKEETDAFDQDAGLEYMFDDDDLGEMRSIY